MVKSNARCHFIQYIKNKPTKWGVNLWILADMTGYTDDFNNYTGKSETQSDLGLSNNVVIHLVQLFAFQGYKVYRDNFYTSPSLLEELLTIGIMATGTSQSTRSGIPDDVIVLTSVLEKKAVTRGTGYYIWEGSAQIVYFIWKDTCVVSVMSTAHPGHQRDKKVSRCVSNLDASRRKTVEVPLLISIEWYNRCIGEVNKSDQVHSYHNIFTKTVMTSFVLYKHLALLSDCWTVSSENDFHDDLVLQIIQKYGKHQAEDAKPGRPSSSDCRVRHGSMLASYKARCHYCKLVSKSSLIQRRCLDCLGQPALCQTSKADCHSLWHAPSFDAVRDLWFTQYQTKHAQQPQQHSSSAPQHSGPGRLKGSINKKKRHSR